MSVNIWEKAVCLQVKMSKPGETRKSKKAKVEGEANDDWVSVGTRIIDSPELTAIRNLDTSMRNWLKAIKLPGSIFKDGIYPICLNHVEKVEQQIDKFEEERQQLVDAFIVSYQGCIDDAKANLADLFDESNHTDRDWETFST